MRDRYDAVVVGAGPNGLAAAITLAQAGQSVLLAEARETVGGGMRTSELTLPGFCHDVCSAVHPLALASPFFRSLPLEQYGLEWIEPPAPLAHPLDDGPAVMLEHTLEATAANLGRDAQAYHRLIEPIVARAGHLVEALLAPPLPVPRHPIDFAGFGLRGLRSARGLARGTFAGERARALFAGLAGHSVLPLEAPLSATFGLTMAMLAHYAGWPSARGGSQRIADALAAHLRALGGEVVTGFPVESLDALPPARAVLFDVAPRHLARIAGERLPAGYRRALGRYRHAPGAFKVDFALDGPIPWTSPECARAGTVHLGGTLDEIAASERAVGRGEHPERPYVILVQASLFDATRAPDGKHTAWAYCHVPNGSTVDMTARIEAQIERFAPGFRDVVLARSVMSPAAFERYNPNYVGGDVVGGIQDLPQVLARPVPALNPYRTPASGIYLCSASTPPGGGVHGMCGYWAARTALRDLEK